MKVTILCNNSVKTFSRCIAEHGFSAYIETDEGNYLFDTGAGYGVIENAIMLDKDLRNINGMILSHGHSDHCGGLEKVLRYRKAYTPIYAHPGIFAVRYVQDDQKKLFAGIPTRKELLESLGADFKFSKGFRQISKDIYLTGEVERKNSFELFEKDLLSVSDIDSSLEIDPILDDNSLAINSANGIILLLGCAHTGLVNIMNHVTEHLGVKSLYAILGGTHMAQSDDNRVSNTIEAIKKFNVQKIGTCHCTGSEKEALLKAVFRERFFFAQVGTEFIF